MQTTLYVVALLALIYLVVRFIQGSNMKPPSPPLLPVGGPNPVPFKYYGDHVINLKTRTPYKPDRAYLPTTPMGGGYQSIIDLPIATDWGHSYDAPSIPDTTPSFSGFGGGDSGGGGASASWSDSSSSSSDSCSTSYDSGSSSCDSSSSSSSDF